MSAPTFDLQSHSLVSDGALAPEEVVAAAAAAGVTLLALTDHDSIDGLERAATAAHQADVTLAPGVEISAIDNVHGDLHILGYDFDPDDTALRERLDAYREQRRARSDAMEAALRDCGFEIDEGPLRARAAAGASIGRPHLAEAVTAHPANAARLAREGCEDPSALLEAYLIPAAPAFVPRQGPAVADAIEAIHRAGGVAIWAHPFWDVSDPGEVLTTLERFLADGLDGAECFYVTHDRAHTAVLAERCARDQLLATGSSDFHGPAHRQFRAFRAFDTYGFTPRLGPIDRRPA